MGWHCKKNIRRGIFRTQSNIYDGAFSKKFYWVLNTPLIIFTLLQYMQIIVITVGLGMMERSSAFENRYEISMGSSFNFVSSIKRI